MRDDSARRRRITLQLSYGPTSSFGRRCFEHHVRRAALGLFHLEQDSFFERTLFQFTIILAVAWVLVSIGSALTF